MDEICIEVAHSIDVFSGSKSAVPTVRISKTTRNRCNLTGKNRLWCLPQIPISPSKLLFTFTSFSGFPSYARYIIFDISILYNML